jgi:hypothetical protein
MATVGNLDWQDCETCRFYRELEGGCDPLEEGGEKILSIDIVFDEINCERYEFKKRGGVV